MDKRKVIQCVLILIIVVVLAIIISILPRLINNDKNVVEDKQVNEAVDSNASFSGESIDDSTEYILIPGTKMLGDIEISNIKINQIEKRKCEVTADVKNISDKYLEPTFVKLKVINESGEVDEVFGGIITALAGYEPNKFTTRVLEDITDANDIEFEVINE